MPHRSTNAMTANQPMLESRALVLTRNWQSKLLAVLIVLTLIGVACGDDSNDAAGIPSMTPAVASYRVTEVMRDTIEAVGLASFEFEVYSAEYRDCDSAGRDRVSYTWSLDFPAVTESTARAAMREMHSYWTEEAPRWTDGDYEVVDDGIDTKTIAGVNLYLDGFTLGADFSRDSLPPFTFSGHSPCVVGSPTEAA